MKGNGSIVCGAASWKKNPHCRVVSVSSRSKESAQKLADEMQLDCAVGDVDEMAEASLAHCRSRLPTIKVPRGVDFAQIMDELAYGESG